jgi:hypothetical protein
MRTQGLLLSDTPHTGGFLLFGAAELLTFSSNLVLTRNALGDYSYNRTASGAETYYVVFELAELKKVVSDLNATMFQEQFGTAAGSAGYPASVAGFPPYTGATQLVQPTAPTPKGIKVTDVVAIYQPGVVSLTSASLSLNRTQFANNVANVITNMPIAATALPLTVPSTGPYSVVRAVTTPVFETSDLSDVSLEFSFVMANTGTIRVYGLGVHMQYNYN